MRCFVAIELPGNIRKALAKIQGELAKTGADVRWVRPENIHLTLKFLGNTEKDQVEKIPGILKSVCSSHTVFDLEISGTGIFPNLRSPRVLWTGVHCNDALRNLQKDIDSAMAALGFKKDGRKFVPHLTHGRFRSSRGREALLKQLKIHENHSLGLMSVRYVYLMESELSPAGARHKKIAEISIGN